VYTDEVSSRIGSEMSSTLVACAVPLQE